MSIELFQHQKEDLAALLENPYYALFHEVGSGKTYPLIYAMLAKLLGQRGMWLVVAEVQLLDQWKEEILKVAGDQELDVQILTGRTKKSERALIMRNPPDVLLTNYEFVKVIYMWLYEAALRDYLLGITLDEAHRIKGFRGMRSKYGKRAKALIQIAHARLGQDNDIVRWEATGSPIVNPNSPDIWALYYFLHPDIMGKTLYRFEQEFFFDVAQGQPYKKLILKPGMKGEIGRRMYLCARRLLKSELPVEFPEQATIPYRVELPAKLKKFYKQLADHCVADVDGTTVTRAQLLGRLQALQQAATGFILERVAAPVVGLDISWDEFNDPNVDEKQVIHIDSSHKDKVLLSIMDEIGADRSVVVWAHYRHEIAHVVDLLKKGGYSAVAAYGGVTQSQKAANIEAFKQGHAKVLVAQPASCGAGLNLQIAGHSIRYSRSHRLIDYDQSVGRIHRPLISGAHNHVTYHEIIATNCSDLGVYESLIGKKDLSSELTLDGFMELRT